ncbi:MAG: hypothetical protein R2838_08755 [Caldilineaceae bacterium]
MAVTHDLALEVVQDGAQGHRQRLLRLRLLHHRAEWALPAPWTADRR